jgi:hypothetical protein
VSLLYFLQPHGGQHKEPNIQYSGGECVEYAFLKLNTSYVEDRLPDLPVEPLEEEVNQEEEVLNQEDREETARKAARNAATMAALRKRRQERLKQLQRTAPQIQ